MYWYMTVCHFLAASVCWSISLTHWDKFDQSEAWILEAGKSGRKKSSLEALRHPIRVRIMEVCTEYGPLSPVKMLNSKLVADIDSVKSKKGKARLSHVAYHCRKLVSHGCLELVAERPVRGANEHFYRATAQAFFSDEEWAELNELERRQISKTMWWGFIARVENAQLGEKFDSRVDRWLAWQPLELDARGWKEMIASVAGCYAEVEQIKRESEARLEKKKDGEKEEDGYNKAMQATFGIFAFESPERLILPDDADKADTPDKADDPNDQ